MEKALKFYHICTDGTHNGIVHFSDEDYQEAIKISAIDAYKNGIIILAYCHMSTHSHFVVAADDYDSALSFSNDYKREYARYSSFHNGHRKVYHNIDSTPIEITDSRYLKNCIAYTLLNPVVAGIVRRPEEYEWSSFSTYFNKAECAGHPVNKLGVRECRHKLHTKEDLSKSVFIMDECGHLVPKSIVAYGFVEQLFRSITDFFRALALTDSSVEETRYVFNSLNYSDTELIAEALTLASRYCHKDSLNQLTKDEKFRILSAVRKKTGATPKRLARIFRIKPEEINFLCPLS
ncbi:MAG: hypothetical protein MJY50_04255 [Bacteroidales bacterium]|nr:hypothetical protein [Bacteroidales bacterium]